MQPARLRSALVGLALLVLATDGRPATPPRDPVVLVDTGPHHRHQSLVSFAFDEAPGPSWTLVTDQDARLPVQRDADRAWFILPDAPAHTTLRLRLVQTPASPPAPRATARSSPSTNTVTLALDGQPALTYVAGPGQLPRADIRPEFLRGGYLHPIRTPAGAVVTDDYPPNHIHHHGVWWSWTKTRFEGRTPDFWNMGDRKGRTDFDALHDVFEGPVFSGFRSSHQFTDLLAPQPKVALRERWTVRLLAARTDPHGHLVDLESEQRCASDSPLVLPKYLYGGLAYRGPFAWNGPTHARYLDSNGVTNRVQGNETRVRWHWMGGLVEGRLVGIASLGHPSNFRAPQPVRVHPQEPYHCWSPSQLGDWEIQPGQTFVSRYRLVPMDGEPDPRRLDQLWHDFAEPPHARRLD